MVMGGAGLGISRGEVSGAFLLGLVESFCNLHVLPQNEVYLPSNDFSHEKWYAYSELTDMLHCIDKTVPFSKSIFFHAGINFIRIWYEHGPGKTMINSGLDWLHANTESQGYNSVVRGGSPLEIGWCRLKYISIEDGIAIYENVMPLTGDFLKGIFYGGCILFDDMEYVRVEAHAERYHPNPYFNRTMITVCFRLKSKSIFSNLERYIDNFQRGDAPTLSQEEVISLIWQFKWLKDQIHSHRNYYSDIKNFLVKAVSTMQLQREKITHLSNHDELTGLPNLRLAREMLNVAFSHGIRNRNSAALLFIDLDGFKLINDKFGHNAGDNVLNEAAKRLKSALREVDFAARIGGDEFILILNDITDDMAAEILAGKIINLIAKPIFYNNDMFLITASVGIALYPENGVTPEEILINADHAMYAVKRSGGNGFLQFSAYDTLKD